MTYNLRKLTGKNTPWKWEHQHRNEFQLLKLAVSEESTLAHYNQNRETFLIVDDSPVGLGAILAQKQDDNTIRPVYFASKSLTSTEQNYSQIEREF